MSKRTKYSACQVFEQEAEHESQWAAIAPPINFEHQARGKACPVDQQRATA